MLISFSHHQQQQVSMQIRHSNTKYLNVNLAAYYRIFVYIINNIYYYIYIIQIFIFTYHANNIIHSVTHVYYFR